jgi:hypothetical protein
VAEHTQRDQAQSTIKARDEGVNERRKHAMSGGLLALRAHVLVDWCGWGSFKRGEKKEKKKKKSYPVSQRIPSMMVRLITLFRLTHFQTTALEEPDLSRPLSATTRVAAKP